MVGVALVILILVRRTIFWEVRRPTYCYTEISLYCTSTAAAAENANVVVAAAAVEWKGGRRKITGGGRGERVGNSWSHKMFSHFNICWKERG